MFIGLPEDVIFTDANKASLLGALLLLAMETKGDRGVNRFLVDIFRHVQLVLSLLSAYLNDTKAQPDPIRIRMLAQILKIIALSTQVVRKRRNSSRRAARNYIAPSLLTNHRPLQELIDELWYLLDRYAAILLPLNSRSCSCQIWREVVFTFMGSTGIDVSLCQATGEKLDLIFQKISGETMRMSQIVSGVVVLVDCFAHPCSYRSLAENGTSTSLSPGGASSANLITSAWTENEHQDHGFEDYLPSPSSGSSMRSQNTSRGKIRNVCDSFMNALERFRQQLRRKSTHIHHHDHSYIALEAEDAKVSILDTVTAILLDREGVRWLEGLEHHIASCIELLDQVVDNMPNDIQKTAMKVLDSLCARTGLLPQSSHIPHHSIKRLGEWPVAHGGFADIWLGLLHGQDVALKMIRLFANDDVEKVRQIFTREFLHWKRLRHPNILPLIGMSDIGSNLCMISPWLRNGDVVRFARHKPSVDRTALLLDIAYGLDYLHSVPMVHGDLKGANILIDDQGHALLADFGLAALMRDFTSTQTTSTTQHHHGKGTTRWMAPELLNPELFGTSSRHTEKSDIYAFGMVMLELYTGRIPFHEIAWDASVILRVMRGDRPRRTLGIPADIWHLMNMCWQGQREQRPGTSSIIANLKTHQGVDNRRRRVDSVQTSPDVITRDLHVVADEEQISRILWSPPSTSLSPRAPSPEEPLHGVSHELYRDSLTRVESEDTLDDKPCLDTFHGLPDEARKSKHLHLLELALGSSVTDSRQATAVSLPTSARMWSRKARRI